MNDFLEYIRNVNERVVSSIFFGFVILGNWIDHWGYFITLLSLAYFICLVRFFHDKKWLFETDKYMRINKIEPFWKRALGFIFVIVVTFVIIEYSDRIDFEMKPKMSLSLLLLSVAIYIGNYYHKFVDSIKSFDEGIQFPGRKQELIPWKEVYEFRIDEKVYISSSKGENEFDISEEDLGFTRAMISEWKEKNGRRKENLSNL